MFERESAGVEELPGQTMTSRVPVVRVAGHGVADGQQVRADLVGAARLEGHAQQRVLREALLRLEVGDRVVRVVGVRADLRPHPAVAAERRVDRAAARGRAALDERDVLAGDVARPQCGLQRGVRRLVAGEHEQPRGVAVEPVHDARAVRVRAAGHAALQRLYERALGVALARMYDDARGLVDDDQVLVLVGDRERRGRDRLARRLGRGLDVDPLAAVEHVALGLGHAIDAHQAGVDPALRLRPRAGVRGQEDVQPLARGLGRNVHLVFSSTHSSAMTPTVTAMSATLKAGQCGILMKSVTEPARMRSIRLPAAPPISRPVGSHTSRRCRWVTKKPTSAASATIATMTTTGPPPENSENATPVFLVWIRSSPGMTSTVSPVLMFERTTAFAT